MTIAAPPESTPEQRERIFFLFMSLVIAGTVLTGFSLFYLGGFSSFSAPWWVHLHGVTFMLWIAFFIGQNTLVFRNNIALHRKLGRIGAVYVIWMVLVGLVLTPLTIASGRYPPVFSPAFFLALDGVNILFFGGLMYAAIHNRKRTDWHRRLMLCATFCVIAPAIGRLIVLSGNTLTAVNNISFLLIFVVVAMIADRIIRGRIHPAYYWGGGALVSMAATIELLAVFPPFVTMVGRIAA